MSVLIVAGNTHIDGLLARRLVEQGDVVGILVEDDGMIDHVDPGDAHVAQGSRTDEDLIERAATHARTIVVYEEAVVPTHRDIVRAVVAAAKRIEGVRVVMWGSKHSAEAVETLSTSGLPYVVIHTGKLRGRLRRTVPFEAVVEALDAADDLAGDVHLEVDLTRDEEWARLKLEPPS
ncbi:MAG: hypothetical protein GEU78_01600 [Actinobacteria bacterium]|nr:hypothetical protein [Actinomycetota bacterium]